MANLLSYTLSHDSASMNEDQYWPCARFRKASTCSFVTALGYAKEWWKLHVKLWFLSDFGDVENGLV
jgi:hypothetical protein